MKTEFDTNTFRKKRPKKSKTKINRVTKKSKFGKGPIISLTGPSRVVFLTCNTWEKKWILLGDIHESSKERCTKENNYQTVTQELSTLHTDICSHVFLESPNTYSHDVKSQQHTNMLIRLHQHAENRSALHDVITFAFQHLSIPNMCFHWVDIREDIEPREMFVHLLKVLPFVPDANVLDVCENVLSQTIIQYRNLLQVLLQQNDGHHCDVATILYPLHSELDMLYRRHSKAYASIVHLLREKLLQTSKIYRRKRNNEQNERIKVHEIIESFCDTNAFLQDTYTVVYALNRETCRNIVVYVGVAHVGNILKLLTAVETCCDIHIDKSSTSTTTRCIPHIPTFRSFFM